MSTSTGTRTGIDQVRQTLGATTRPQSVGLTHLAPGRWASKAAAFTNARPHSGHSTSVVGAVIGGLVCLCRAALGAYGVLRRPADVAAPATVGVVVAVGAQALVLHVSATVAETLVPEMAQRYDGHR